MLDSTFIVMFALRWIHFIGGVTWIGSLFYLRFVVFPSMKTPKPHLSMLSVSKLSTLLIITSISGITAGVAMALILSGLNTGIFTSTDWGIAISLGAFFALLLLITTFVGVIPTLEQLSEAAEGSSLKDNLLRRGELWLNVAVGLALTILLAMAYAGSIS